VLLWQGGNNQDPSREVEGIWPYLLLVLLCLALGTSLSLFLLLLAQTKSDQTQLDPLVQVCDPDRTTLDVPCGRLQSLEPVHDHDRGSLLIFHRKLGWADANDDVCQFGENKCDAGTQAIGPISDHQISWLQIENLQMLSLLAIGHFDLCEPTCQ